MLRYKYVNGRMLLRRCILWSFEEREMWIKRNKKTEHGKENFFQQTKKTTRVQNNLHGKKMWIKVILQIIETLSRHREFFQYGKRIIGNFYEIYHYSRNK